MARMILERARHLMVRFWRIPIAAFFTLVFPLIFLVLIGGLAGNDVIEARSGIRVAQFLAPAVGAFAAATSAYTMLAIGVAFDRETRVLKRVRGTPLPAGAYIAARLASAAAIGLLAVLVMVVVGVLAYDVQVVWRTVPAALVTLLVGLGCFSALGLAVVALAPSAAAVQAITNATLVPVAFLSDVFVVGIELPRWLDVIGWVFPLKHFANAMGDTFNPFLTGGGWSGQHLLVMVAWGLAAGAVAAWRFSWEPKAAPGPRRRAVVEEAASAGRVTFGEPEVGAPPSTFALGLAQVRHGVVAFLRDRSAAFFTLVFPVILLALFATIFDNPTLEDEGGIDFAQFATPGMAVYGIAMAGYVTFAERLARARDQRELQRVGGTPLPLGAFLAGRIGSTVVVAVMALVITVGFGMVAFGVELVPRMFPGVVLSLVLGIGCFTALGIALASLAPSSEAVPAIANATLLPLGFVSDVFIVGDAPSWMKAVGNVFPLRHVVRAVANGFNPTISGIGVFPLHWLVTSVWLLAAVLVTLRTFTWKPR